MMTVTEKCVKNINVNCYFFMETSQKSNAMLKQVYFCSIHQITPMRMWIRAAQGRQLIICMPKLQPMFGCSGTQHYKNNNI